MEILQKLTSVAMLTFVLSSMLAMGLSLRISEIIHPLRSPRLVALSLVANFIVMPVAAFQNWRKSPKAILHSPWD